jgi:hypothetical protein
VPVQTEASARWGGWAGEPMESSVNRSPSGTWQIRIAGFRAHVRRNGRRGSRQRANRRRKQEGLSRSEPRSGRNHGSRRKGRCGRWAKCLCLVFVFGLPDIRLELWDKLVAIPIKWAYPEYPDMASRRLILLQVRFAKLKRRQASSTHARLSGTTRRAFRISSVPDSHCHFLYQ